MNGRTELLKRVREAAETIQGIFTAGSNAPLEDYVDAASLNALCDTLRLEPEAWQGEDLERILVIRDGLYTLRNKLRDANDEAEHSIDQFLYAMDRLYTDLERALRAFNEEELKKAQEKVAALQRGPHISAAVVPNTVANLQREASELLTQSHMTYRHIELSFLKIDRSDINIEILQSIKLSVQRLGASVFAIKLSLENTIIYQGIFKFLTDGADKIITELREQVKASYAKAAEFAIELATLAEKGGRFSKLVTEFLRQAFAQADKHEDRGVTLRVQTTLSGEAVLSAAVTDKKTVLLAGKNGNAWVAHPGTSRFVPRYRLHERAVTSLAMLDDDLVALGTDDGLEVVSIGEDSEEYTAGVRERVVSIAVPPWGAKGSRGTIVTGSREGVLRRFTLAGGLTQFSREAYEKIGRRVTCLISNGQEVIASTGIELLFVP